MANRSYLYSLSNRPSSYVDRPDTVSGLSEWPYDVPFMYRLLMSGDPQLCASLIADGFDSDEPESKTALYAISSHFDTGFARVKRFTEIIRAATADLPSAVEPAAAPAPQSASLINRLKQLFAPRQDASSSAVSSGADAQAPLLSPRASADELLANLDETIEFLEAHRDTYLLLETIELDTMSESEEAELKACVEQEIARCVQAGAAVDALSADLEQAGKALRLATQRSGAAPMDAFFGLRLDNDCDSTRTGDTEYPLGLVWYDTLYFDVMNRSEFDAQQN